MSLTRKAHLDTFAITLLLACCMFWGSSRCCSRPRWPRCRRCSRPLCALPWPRRPSAPGACGAGGSPLALQPQGSWRAGLLAGALFAGEFACIYVGLQYTSASRLTVFLYSSPFWLALLLPRFIPGERLHLAMAGPGGGVCGRGAGAGRQAGRPRRWRTRWPGWAMRWGWRRG